MAKNKELLEVLANEVKKGNLDITIDKLHRIFQPYYSRQKTRAEKIRMLESNNVLIKIESGVGAKFRINIEKLRELGALPKERFLTTIDREEQIKQYLKNIYG